MIDTLKTCLTNKQTEKIIALISRDPGILDEKDENGTSGLLLIAYSGLDKAFQTAKKLKRSATFHESIVCGFTDKVNEALESDDSLVNAYSADGFAPVSLAAFFGQPEIAKLLLEKGADPDLQATNPSKVNALHSAVAREDIDLCRLLIGYRVDINAAQMQHVTALHSAAHRGNLELVRLLVENGANINLKMDSGETARELALKEGHADVASYLENASGNFA